MPSSLTPVLLGLDLNAYSMALSFYEAFGVISHAFGRYACGITERSKFIRTHIVPDFCEGERGADALRAFRKEQKGADLFLVPCADWYMAFLERERDRLEGYRFFIPPREIFEKVSDKASFLELMDRFGIPHPKTRVFRYGDPTPERMLEGAVGYPAVVKPSESTEYWRHPFPDMRKVWFVKNAKEASETIRRIFASGYRKSIILQEKIGQKRDPEAVTLTVCCDENGRPTTAIRGRILLEEVAPTARGNYCAIVTAPIDAISKTLMDFCYKIGYRGIANFDILYHENQPYVLEMNPRQGRSCDYVRAAGGDLARFLVRAAAREPLAAHFRYPAVYWRCVPDRTVRRYATDRALLAEAEALAKAGYVFSPFHGTDDVRGNLLRRAYVAVHEARRGAAFRKFAVPFSP